MNARGQFWSLDVVLAAAIFTLAVGLILSQSELFTFYGQQDRLSRQLVSALILGSNNLMSQRDLIVNYTPAFCDPLQYLHPDHISPSLCRSSISTCGGPSQPPCVANVVDVTNSSANIRCGPNADYRVDALPTAIEPAVISRTIHGWLSDNELTNLENCLVDYNSPIRGTQINLTQSFNFDMNYVMGNGGTAHYFLTRPGNNPFLSIQRKIVAFPNMPSPSLLRDCMDGACSSYVTDLNFRVWQVE